MLSLANEVHQLHVDVYLQASCTPLGTMSRPSSTHTTWCQTQASDARWRQRHERRLSGLGGTPPSAGCATCSTSEPSVSTRHTRGERSIITIVIFVIIKKKRKKKGKEQNRTEHSRTDQNRPEQNGPMNKIQAEFTWQQAWAVKQCPTLPPCASLVGSGGTCFCWPWGTGGVLGPVRWTEALLPSYCITCC